MCVCLVCGLVCVVCVMCLVCVNYFNEKRRWKRNGERKGKREEAGRARRERMKGEK